MNILESTPMTAVSAPQLSHVHLKVRSLETSLPFYQELFALNITERSGDHFVFLSSTEAHHDLALQALGERAPGPARATVGLYHVAFEVSSLDELAVMAEKLERLSVPFQAVDHGISRALYFEDPDGNGLEVFVDRRREGRAEWRGSSARLSAAELTGRR